jgi:hypothetical protein
MKSPILRKHISVILALVMILSVMPIAVFGDGEKTVVSITADDKTDIYFGNGWYIYSENGRYFYYNDSPENVTVTYSDGTTFTGEIWEFSDEFGVELDYESNQSYTNQWGLGEHTCTLTLGNIISGTYKVNVVPSNIKSISASPITLTQNCTEDGYYYEEENYFRYNFNPGSFTVTYMDDTTESFTNADDFWQHYEYYIDVGTDQSAQNPWGLGTHTANVSITGVTCQMTVNIVESPVLSVTTNDETVVEGTNGNMSGYWDEATQQYIDNVYFRYNLDIYSKTYTVTYKNGDVFTGTPEEIYNQTGHYVDARDLQNYDNPFTVGSNTVPISFYGCEGSFNFIVTPTPVASITVSPLTVVEEGNGYMAGYYDENLHEWIDDAYFKYTYSLSDIQCTVTYNDGTPTFTGSLLELQNQSGVDVIILDWQTYNHQFTLGDNVIPIRFMGVSSSFTVHVNPSPIVSVSVGNITRIEGTSESWYRDSEGHYYPDYAYPTDINITMSDGTISHFNHPYDVYDELGINFWYEPEIDFDFYNQWTPGTYNVTGHLGTKTCQYTVTVTASPIESLTITDNDIVYAAGTNGGVCTCYDGDEYVGEYFLYSFDPNIEVEFTDGTIFTGLASEFGTEYGYYVRFMDDQGLDNEWGAGNHEVTAYLLGCFATFNVQIVEDGYISIIINDYNVYEGDYPYTGIYTDGQGVDHEYPLYEQPEEIQIICGDGSSIYGDIYDIYNETGMWVNFTSDNSYDNPWGVGDHYVTATFGNLETTFCVTVLQPIISSISVNDITLDEYSDGYWADYYDGSTYEGSYYRYEYYLDYTEITVTRADGTTFTGTPYEISNEFGVYPEFTDTQSYENPWTRNGINTITATLANASTTFNAVLNPYPISSVSINPVSVIINTNGWDQTIWDENGDETGTYYHYSNYEPTGITVTFSDGTPTFTGTPDEFNDLYGNDYWFSTFDYQNEANQWVSGTNTAYAEIGNFRTGFDVLIVNSPVLSVDVNIPTMIKESSNFGYMDSEWNDNDHDWTNRFFYYWIEINDITVTFSDGTPTFTGSAQDFYDEFGYSFNYSLEQSFDSHLIVGNNIIPFSLMGYQGTFTVTIIESPIQLVNGEIVTTMPGTKLKFMNNFGDDINPAVDALGTNYMVKCVTDDANEDEIDTMYIVLYGDLSSSDALVNNSDIDEAMEYLVNGSEYYGVLADASDVNHNGVFDAFDIALMDLIASGSRAKEIGLSRGW